MAMIIISTIVSLLAWASADEVTYFSWLANHWLAFLAFHFTLASLVAEEKTRRKAEALEAALLDLAKIVERQEKELKRLKLVTAQGLQELKNLVKDF